MKRKLFSIALVVVLALALSVNAFAADSPSGSVTPTPVPDDKPTTTPGDTTNPAETPDKTDVAIKDADGNTFPADNVQIDGVGDVNSLTGTEKKNMETAINAVNNASSNAGTFVANAGMTTAVDNALAAAGATGVKAADLKINSLFNISVSGAAKAAMQNGKALTFALKIPGISANMVSVALHYNGSAWEVVPSTAGDGVVNVTLSSLSPVVIMTAPRATAPTNPSNPSNPSNPTNPSKPTTPSNPTTPTTPSNPSSPAPAPAAPTTNKVTSPQTSDVNLEGIVLLTSALACAAACAYCMKRSQKA